MVIGKEIKISLTAICTVVLLFYGINFLKGVNMFKKNNMYYVAFSDITGLSKNNAVYANGFPVGTVREIDYDFKDPGHVIVGIEIDERMRLPEGTHAELASSLLGATTMNLILGETNRFLQPGDSISGGPENGALAKASAMIPKVEAVLPKIDSMMTTINIILADPSIRQTLHNAEEVTANLKTTTDRMNRLLGKDVPQLTARLNHIGQNVDQLTAKLNALDYAQTLNSVNSTLDDTRRLVSNLNDKVNSPQGSLGLLLNDRTLYDNLNNTLVSADTLLTNLKAHPKRYVHFSLFGKKDK
jgi:phospholipid/cholesterol/gamma-HCH transport system substrate-binding protein